jgi:hypothetical protein
MILQVRVRRRPVFARDGSIAMAARTVPVRTDLVDC